jgi:hypothetical protein
MLGDSLVFENGRIFEVFFFAQNLKVFMGNKPPSEPNFCKEFLHALGGIETSPINVNKIAQTLLEKFNFAGREDVQAHFNTVKKVLRDLLLLDDLLSQKSQKNIGSDNFDFLQLGIAHGFLGYAQVAQVVIPKKIMEQPAFLFGEKLAARYCELFEETYLSIFDGS